jgi:hypothetical protein
MNATIIVPSKLITNLSRCLAAVHLKEPNSKVTVIDDGLNWRGWNQPGGPTSVIPGVKPFVFARNVNLGIQASAPSDVILLNDDATLQTPGGFTKLEEVAKANPEFGVIAAAVDLCGNVNQSPQAGEGLRLETWTLCFVCVYIPRSVIDRVGLLDERFVTYGSEDNDYAHRVKLAGLKLGVFDGCFLKHSELRSTFRGNPRSGGAIAQGRAIYKEKWGMEP